MSSARSFAETGLPASLQRVLSDRGITTPTPIQAATLADAIAGRDVLGRGRTGSGKTYAFLLPLVTRLSQSPRPRRSRQPRALILAPTRELAGQIDTALAPLAATAGLTSITIFGGVGERPQIAGLRNGVDVVVACPGRLEALIRSGACSLSEVEITILDEADHMADLGFLPAVTRLLSQTPARGQRMLFSATLDAAVSGLVKRFLHDPARHEADSAVESPALLAHHVLHVSDTQHFPVLTELAAAPGRTIIFTRTKHRAKAIARKLTSVGVPAVELHANLSQNARARSLESFQSGSVTTLVATDIAARGIHVDDIGLVVHADPPVDPKAYVHRSGRTARAGKAGTVITLMTTAQLGDLKRLARAAGIAPVTTKVDSIHHPMLEELAPGERPERRIPVATPAPVQTASRSPRGSGARGRSGPSAGGPKAAPRQRTSGTRRSDTVSATAPATHSAAGYSSRSRRRRAG